MIKKTTIIFGIILALFGLLGFLPNPIVGRHAFFMADSVHNSLHLILGIGLIAMGLKSASAGLKSLKIIGSFFILIAVAGFFTEDRKFLGMFSINLWDTWLHLFLGGLLLFYSEKFSKQWNVEHSAQNTEHREK